MISADKFFTFFVIPNQIKTFGVGFKRVCVYQHIHFTDLSWAQKEYAPQRQRDKEVTRDEA